jgi:serine/threonine protein kinase
MGTAAYMAPEQARGQAVDKRADVWAYGVVLWEMLTGRRMFTGGTVSDVLAAVLTKEPDLEAVPPRVRRLLGACLEKDPQRRLGHLADAWRLLASGAEAPRRLKLAPQAVETLLDAIFPRSTSSRRPRAPFAPGIPCRVCRR